MREILPGGKKTEKRERESRIFEAEKLFKKLEIRKQILNHPRHDNTPLHIK